MEYVQVNYVPTHYISVYTSDSVYLGMQFTNQDEYNAAVKNWKVDYVLLGEAIKQLKQKLAEAHIALADVLKYDHHPKNFNELKKVQKLERSLKMNTNLANEMLNDRFNCKKRVYEERKFTSHVV
jgi:hypothetical protein